MTQRDDVIKTDLGQMVDSGITWLCLVGAGQLILSIFAYFLIKAFDNSASLGLTVLVAEVLVIWGLYRALFYIPPAEPVAKTRLRPPGRPLPGSVATDPRISARAKELMDEELKEHLKRSLQRDFGKLSERRWGIELDVPTLSDNQAGS